MLVETKHAGGHAHHPPASTLSKTLTAMALGGIAATAGIILAPHLLPMVGIGTEQLAADAMWVTHSREMSSILPIGEAGSGLAGILNRGMANYVPLIGERLAEGEMFTALTAATIGLGGRMLGNFITTREDGSHNVNLGRFITYGSLITSALIALPTILSGLTTGILFLAALTPETMITSANLDSLVGHLDSTIGVSGAPIHNAFLGLSGGAAALAHVFTCGITLSPIAIPLIQEESDIIAQGFEQTPDAPQPNVSDIRVHPHHLALNR